MIKIALIALIALVCVVFTETGCNKNSNESLDTQTQTQSDDSDDNGTDIATDTGTGTGTENGSGSSVVDLRDAVEKDRYVSDLVTVAVVREPGSEAWGEIQQLCADRFEELGYEVELHQYDSGVNVIGKKLGTSMPDEQIIVSAHYDHIPGCTGADDNASGVAGTLEVARVLSDASFERTLVVACWDEEEFGYLGSKAYAARAAQNNEHINVAFVFEMIGYKSDEPNTQDLPPGFELAFPEQVNEIKDNDNRGDFILFVGDEESETAVNTLEQHVEQVGIAGIIMKLSPDQMTSPLYNDLKRSDHAAFWLNGYPAIMITDTSEFRNDAYHCGAREDTVDLLDHDFTTATIKATVAAAAQELGYLDE